MPASVVIEPEEISLADFSGGWMPDLAPQAVPRHGLLDVNNLLPDRETGTLEVRKGYQRFSNLLQSDYEIRTMHPFSRNSGKTNELGQQYLMCVLRKMPRPNPREANDIQIWAVNVQAETAVRVDHTGRIWKHYASGHWGETVDNFYYGGSENDPMYSYKPFFKDGTANPEPWEPDASMGQWASTLWASGQSYSVGDRRSDTVTIEKTGGGTREVKYVFICTTAHTSANHNRPGKLRGRDNEKWENMGKHIPIWVDGTEYEIGDTVSQEITDTTIFDKFPRGYASSNKKSTFICVRAHTATTSNKPNGGPWEPYRAPIANVAKYHASRLFIRDSDAGAGRLHYSDLITAEGLFDPTEWDSDNVQGAGYMDIRSGDGDDIRALETLNKNLIICKRRTVWALRGFNPSTWSLDQIGDVGALYKNGITQHEGLVYFFGDEGFFVTDGVTVQEVENGSVIRDWIHDNVDLEDNNIYRISMISYLGFIWISFPAGDFVTRPNLTLVYDPVTASFWKLNIGSNKFVVQRKDRVDELFFAPAGLPAMPMRYSRIDAGGVPDANMNKDDTRAVTQAFQEITWFAHLPWLTFGSWKEQRRIRRLWVRLRAAVGTVVTLNYYRDYATSSFKTINRTTTVAPVTHVEGDAVRDIDPSAISLKVSGDRGNASLINVHFQTKYRRRRNNRGVRA